MAQSLASGSVPPPGKLPPTLTPIGHFAGRPALPISRSVTVIGANKHARLRLLSSSVSQNHAIIVNADSGPYIRDLASREHVLVNGQRVKETALHEGDEIQIGRFSFRFTESPHTQTAGAVRAMAPAPQGQLEVNGEPMPIPLEGKTTLIGRREICDVPLLEDSASTCHAIIFEMDGKRYVRDLHSRTGTYINGQEVHHQAELKDGDELKIGETTMRYGAGPAPATESFAPTAKTGRTSAPAPAAAPIPLAPTDSSAPIPIEHIEEPIEAPFFEQEAPAAADHAPEGTEALELVQDHPAEIEPVDVAPMDLEAPEDQPEQEEQAQAAPTPKLEFEPAEAEPPAEAEALEAPAAPEPGSSNEDFLADLEALAPRTAPVARKKNDTSSESSPAELAGSEPASPESIAPEARAPEMSAPAAAEPQVGEPELGEPEIAAPVHIADEASQHVEAQTPPPVPIETEPAADVHPAATAPTIEVPPEHGAELRATAPRGTELPPGASQLDLGPIGQDQVDLEADLDEASPADTRALPLVEAEAPEPAPLSLSEQVVDFDEEPDTDAIDDALGLLPESPDEPAIHEPFSDEPAAHKPAEHEPIEHELIEPEPAAHEPPVVEASAEPAAPDETELPHPAPEKVIPARSIVDEAEDHPLLITDAAAPAEEAEPPIEGLSFETPEVAALEDEVGLSPTLAQQASEDHVTFGGEQSAEDAPAAVNVTEIEAGEILSATSPEPESALPLEEAAAAQEVPDVAPEEEFTPSDTGFARAVHDFTGDSGALVEEAGDQPSHAEESSPASESLAPVDEAKPTIEAEDVVEADLEPAAETEFPAGASQLDLAPLSPDELQAAPDAAGSEIEERLFHLAPGEEPEDAAMLSAPAEPDVDLDLEEMTEAAPDPAISNESPAEIDLTPDVELFAEPAEEEAPEQAAAPNAADEAPEELKLEAPEAPKAEAPPETEQQEPPSPAQEAASPTTEQPAAPSGAGGAGGERERFNWGPNQEHFLGGMPLKLGPGSAAHPAPEPAAPAASAPAPSMIPPRPNRQQMPPRPIRRQAGASPFADGRRNTIGPAENRPLRTPFDGLAFAQGSGRTPDVFGQNPLPAGLTTGFDPALVHDVFGGAATRVGLVTPSDASRGAFPTGDEAHRTAKAEAPDAPADDDASQPAATRSNQRAGARHLPPEMPPPAAPVKKRGWFGFRMLLLVLAVGGCAAGAWATYRFVPDHSSTTGELHFANVDSLSRQRRVDLWKQQQQLLSSDALRTDARARLATKSAASGGFLDDPDAFARLAASAVFDPDRCIIVLSSTGGASLDDQQRMLALLEAIYVQNQDRVSAYQGLKDKAVAVAAARDASQKTIDELTHQINQLTSASQDRPNDDEKRQLEAQVKQLSSAYVEAAAMVGRITRNAKAAPDEAALRQAQKIRDDASDSLRAAQKQLADLKSRIDEAGTAALKRDALVARREAVGQSLAQQARTYDMDHQAAQAQAYPVMPTAADVHADRKPDSRPRYAAIVCGAIIALCAGLGLLTMIPSRSAADAGLLSELPDFADAAFAAQLLPTRHPAPHARSPEREPVEV